jgi:serine/threonine protein phosphatase PrpC
MQGQSLPYTRARALSVRGRSHAQNDDRYALLDGRLPEVRLARKGSIYAVADGVSSTRQGAAAADVVVEHLRKFFETDRLGTEDLLLDVVEAADAEVRMTTGSASTLAGVWLSHGITTVFCLGDTAVYLYRNGELRRLTPRQVRGGGLAAFVGMGQTVRHNLFLRNLPLEVGDVFLLASDGAYNTVPPKEMRGLLGWDPSKLHDQFLELVAQRTPDDDVTLVQIEVLSTEAQSWQVQSMRDG